jgi:hypothetical protein
MRVLVIGSADFIGSVETLGEPGRDARTRACSRTRDFVHVRDVARAGAPTPQAGRDRDGNGAPRACDIADGEPRTVGEMAAARAKAYGGPAPVGEYRPGDVRMPDRAAAELGLRTSIPVEDGMAEFAARSRTGGPCPARGRARRFGNPHTRPGTRPPRRCGPPGRTARQRPATSDARPGPKRRLLLDVHPPSAGHMTMDERAAAGVEGAGT